MMEGINKTEKLNNNQIYKEKVHGFLAHSYSVYFVLFLFGVFLNFFFKIKVFPSSAVTEPLGFTFLALASILIIWAQKTSYDSSKSERTKVEHFCRGPYCYTRIPTQWGLFFLIIGFGIITNSFFVIMFTVIAFIISKFFFINKHEKILAEKYGHPYLKYKNLVKL